jgi:hypothetical protein
MNPIYEEYSNDLGANCIKATYPDGMVLLIPMDEANSDYQAYLKRDEAKTE